MDDESQHLPPDFALLTLARRPTDIFNRRDPSLCRAGIQRPRYVVVSLESRDRLVTLKRGAKSVAGAPSFEKEEEASSFCRDRGDGIVFRGYRGEVRKGTAEVFFRKVKVWKDDGDGDAKRMPVTTIAKSVDANERGGRKRGNFCGRIYTSEIDGTIQLKMSIGRGGGSAYGNHSAVENAFRMNGVVILDDCNFHESVHLDSFDVDRTLTLVPADGEFPFLNYRITQEFKPPFRINALIEETGLLKADFRSSIIADKILVQIPLPAYTANAYLRVRAKLMQPHARMGKNLIFQTASIFALPIILSALGYIRIVGGSELTLQAKLTFSQESLGNITKEAGPLSMTFTIPMVNPSRLLVKYLHITKKWKSYNPYRWVRYATHSNSYVAGL
ncbi:hypothetical protein TB2_042504 [Malus domestica]